MNDVSINTNPLLIAALEDILRVHTEGLNEIDIINLLDEQYHDIFPKKNLSDSLILFQTHFILFNALYALRDQFWANENGHLVLGPVKICLYPYNYSQHSQTLAEADHVKEYYSDFANMAQTDREGVENLIRSFWQQLGIHYEQPKAFSILGLEYPCEWQDVKKQYRKLAMQHHPDRGGDKERLQEINDAFETVKKVYRNRMVLAGEDENLRKSG
mgnify:FL=1